MKGIEMTTVYNIAVAPNKSYVKYMYVLMESLLKLIETRKYVFISYIMNLMKKIAVGLKCL